MGHPAKTNAGPSTPLKYASLRMTGLMWGKNEVQPRQRAPAVDSAEVRFAQDDRSFGYRKLRLGILAGDEIHDPTESNCRAYEEHKTVEAVAKHLAGRFALGDAEDYGGEEREEHDRGKV
jgi:hypothetical protein